MADLTSKCLILEDEKLSLKHENIKLKNEKHDLKSTKNDINSLQITAINTCISDIRDDMATFTGKLETIHEKLLLTAKHFDILDLKQEIRKKNKQTSSPSQSPKPETTLRSGQNTLPMNTLNDDTIIQQTSNQPLPNPTNSNNKANLDDKPKVYILGDSVARAIDP